MASDAPKVFISYSHDSPEHCDRVLDLAQQLRRDGIDAELDQFHQDEFVNWPRWREAQTKESEFVLCVCTPEYKRQVEGRVVGDVGKGVIWEATLIYHYLYDEKRNPRCIPVLIGGAHEDVIPRILSGWNCYQLTTFRLNGSDPGYEGLYRLLTRQPATLMTEVGTLQKLPPRAIKPELGQRYSEPPARTQIRRNCQPDEGLS
jgi:hypothetical protein